MYLCEALGVSSAEQLDPTRPLKIGRVELGIEATAEAIRILRGGDFPREVDMLARAFFSPTYWSVVHRHEGDAEVFGFPEGSTDGLTTAIELAVVRAIAASAPQNHAAILAGGSEIALGTPRVYHEFRKVLGVVECPQAGKSLLFGQATQAIVDNDIDKRLDKVVLDCLAGSFRASPLKFRFLELYRIMEARFLKSIEQRLKDNFNQEPSRALNDALAALKTEMNQIMGLAETQQEAFEACWVTLHGLKNTNRFVAALFRTIENKNAGGGAKWRTGAALIYQIRCAVVHAGAKDMIFENFPDGGSAVEAVLTDVERAALLLVGIELT